MRDIVERANRELILLGARLRSLRSVCDDVLRRKITEQHVKITFITIDPGIQRRDPIYRMLALLTGSEDFVEALKRAVSQSTGYFRELRSLGQKHGTDVQVLCCREIPMCGLRIADPWAAYWSTTQRLPANAAAALTAI